MNEDKGLLFLELKGLEHKQVKKGDEDFFQFEGYLSTFGNVDLQDDVCVQGCFADSLKLRNPKLLWQHLWKEPIGSMECQEDEVGLRVKGLLPLADSFVRERVVPQIKVGSIDSMSIGFTVVEATWDDTRGIRYLKKVDLWEGSLVTFPANPEAKLDAIKKMKNEYLNPEKKEKRVEEFEMKDVAERWDEMESKERMEGKEVPELPIFDDTEKGLVIVPRALFCLKARILGAKGGFVGDVELAKRYLNKYYEKLGLEVPFESGEKVSFCETEVKNMPISELAWIIRKGFISKSCSDFISRVLVSMVDSQKDSDVSEKEEIKKLTEEFKEKIENLKTKKGD